MELFIKGHPFVYETQNVVRIFFPNDKIEVKETGYPVTGEFVTTEVFSDSGSAVIYNEVYLFGKTLNDKIIIPSVKTDDKLVEANIALSLYDMLSALTGYTPPWGIQTGIRPVKLARKYIKSVGPQKTKEHFENDLQVRPDKAELAVEVGLNEEEIISRSGEKSCSVYISIPFCPTRCDYCSFVSHDIAGAKKLIPEYINTLKKEIGAVSGIIKNLGLKTETIYFGGGTPTSLSASQLDDVLSETAADFDVPSLMEFTVEAGRPDTINYEKMKILKNYGVGRISVNPQTFSDEIRRNIGRRHTTAQFYSAYEDAVKAGFDDINIDLIAGLPGDTVENFSDGVKKAVELGSANITVHTLALKRASELVTDKKERTVSKLTDEMINNSQKLLRENGYIPYYMYKQSKSVGNLENVGWSKPGEEGCYNIYMMDETHSVLSAGAGAVTRLKSFRPEKIERIYNFKYPFEYISRQDILEERKKKITEFYRDNF